jgi:hypothetical protein
LVDASRRGGTTVGIKGGYLQRHSDLLPILSFVAITIVVGSGIYYLGERIHAPMQTRIFAGPVSTI